MVTSLPSMSSMGQVEPGKVVPTWLWAARICYLPHQVTAKMFHKVENGTSLSWNLVQAEGVKRYLESSDITSLCFGGHMVIFDLYFVSEAECSVLLA